jgi:hypothetical protein
LSISVEREIHPRDILVSDSLIPPDKPSSQSLDIRLIGKIANPDTPFRLRDLLHEFLSIRMG